MLLYILVYQDWYATAETLAADCAKELNMPYEPVLKLAQEVFAKSA